VLTVCDNAKQSCPVFFGKAVRLHHSFRDPAAVEGTSEIRLGAFRQVRDELLGCWTEGLLLTGIVGPVRPTISQNETYPARIDKHSGAFRC
jgi:hypothetical protein